MKTGILAVIAFCSVAAHAQVHTNSNTDGSLKLHKPVEGPIYITELCRHRMLEYKPEYTPVYNIRTSTYTMKREDLRTIPTTDVTDIVSLFPAVYQQQRGRDVNIGGSKTDATLYIIDGMQIMR